MIDVSVIIPVYNASFLLDRCLDSVFHQKTDYNIEVVLVDDGSTDDTVSVIKRRKEQDRIILYQQQNAGPAVARNKGVELARGEFCAYLDADDYWLDGYIEETVSFMKMHSECVAVTVAQKYMSEGKLLMLHPAFMNEEYDCSQLSIGEKIQNHQAFVLDDFYQFWREWKHVGTCSTTMRRSALVESGGQRQGLRICEDLEFWPYLATFGQWGFVPKVLYVSDGGALVKQQGWNKYVMRFQNVPMYDKWFERLNQRLSEEQKEVLKPVLNEVICGESRAMISGGDFKRSYENLKFFYKGFPEPYPIKIWKCGRLAYYAYAMLWRFYQYLKINRGVLLRKLHIG